MKGFLFEKTSEDEVIHTEVELGSMDICRDSIRKLLNSDEVEQENISERVILIFSLDAIRKGGLGGRVTHENEMGMRCDSFIPLPFLMVAMESPNSEALGDMTESVWLAVEKDFIFF